MIDVCLIDVERYIGIPWKEMHCWELVRRVYKDVWGVHLPSYEADAEDASAVRALIVEHSRTWYAVPLADALPMDVLTAWQRDKDLDPEHVGVVVGNREMISSYKPRPRVDSYVNGFWGKRIVNCYRYTGDRPNI